MSIRFVDENHVEMSCLHPILGISDSVISKVMLEWAMRAIG